MELKKKPDIEKEPEGGCPRCGGETEYHPIHDAIFCAECDIWLEKACKSSHCEYCSSRPERPLQAPF